MCGGVWRMGFGGRLVVVEGGFEGEERRGMGMGGRR